MADEAIEVRGWCPFEGRRPATDDDYFEALTAAVFQARFNSDVVRQRWPHIREAFAGFDLDEVAAWPDSAVEELLLAPGIIRNRKKILATIRNARDLLARARQHGSVRAYLRSAGDPDALAADIDTWAHYIGAPSIRWFLRCAGIAV